MRLALRLLLSALVLVGPLAGRASAVTIQELLDYRGKLSDDILIALIESDGSVFHLTIADAAKLRDQGLSERVILAMLKTAQRPTPAVTVNSTQSPATPTAPTTMPATPVYTDPGGAVDQYGQPLPTVVTDVPDQGQVVAKTAPVVVNVKQEVTQKVEAPAQNTQPQYAGYPFGYPFGFGYPYAGVIVPAPVVSRAVVSRPVFWGWGGQQRPDSWQLTPTPAPRTTPPQPVPSGKPTATTPSKSGG
jgi:hypothetical protein